jgi:hypothetical protein
MPADRPKLGSDAFLARQRRDVRTMLRFETIGILAEPSGEI